MGWVLWLWESWHGFCPLRGTATLSTSNSCTGQYMLINDFYFFFLITATLKVQSARWMWRWSLTKHKTPNKSLCNVSWCWFTLSSLLSLWHERLLLLLQLLCVGMGGCGMFEHCYKYARYLSFSLNVMTLFLLLIIYSTASLYKSYY